MKALRLIIASVLWLLFLVVQPVFSQSQGTSLEQLKNDYSFQLEKYREAERQFTIDKAEYLQLGTLVSKETALSSLKIVVDYRAKVMEVYLSILETLLRNAQGIDVIKKEQAINRIITVRETSAQHRAALAKLTELEEVVAESVNYQMGFSALTDAQLRAQTLLAIGRIQSAYDQVIIHTDEFKSEYVEPIPDANKKAFINRGLKDVDLQNQNAKVAIDSVRELYEMLDDDREFVRKPDALTVYSQGIKDLQPAFSALKKSVNFLKELERQL